jgi:hypothetical protein
MKNVAHNTRSVAILQTQIGNYKPTFHWKKYPMRCSFTWGIQLLQNFPKKMKSRDTGGSPNFPT